MDPAVKVRSLTKRYRLGPAGGQRNLRETLANLWSRRPVADEATTTLWALRDVSFEIAPGEVVGLIGRNGAGKSTLLKILSKITAPTDGDVTLRGRVGSLLEVGTGFHAELTGRENVFLNGAILGMKRADIRRRFDEIVAFADVERFLDTPVKNYSSGMYMRLAFAVAAHLETEVLLVDEVLAVGDHEFQRKCLAKMQEVARGGRTVVLVSHNVGAIRALCRRALLLEGGRLVDDGLAGEVVDGYLRRVAEGTPLTSGGAGDRLVLDRVWLRNSRGEATLQFAPGEDLTIELVLTAPEPLDRPFLWVGVTGRFGALFGASNLLDDFRPARLVGTSVVRCHFRAPPLLPQTYTVRMGARANDGGTFLLPSQDVASFNVTGNVRDLGLTAEGADSVAWDSASLVVPYEWEMPDGGRFRFRLAAPGCEGTPT